MPQLYPLQLPRAPNGVEWVYRRVGLPNYFSFIHVIAVKVMQKSFLLGEELFAVYLLLKIALSPDVLEYLCQRFHRTVLQGLKNLFHLTG